MSGFNTAQEWGKRGSMIPSPGQTNVGARVGSDCREPQNQHRPIDARGPPPRLPPPGGPSADCRIAIPRGSMPLQSFRVQHGRNAGIASGKGDDQDDPTTPLTATESTMPGGRVLRGILVFLRHMAEGVEGRYTPIACTNPSFKNTQRRADRPIAVHALTGTLQGFSGRRKGNKAPHYDQNTPTIWNRDGLASLEVKQPASHHTDSESLRQAE